MFLIRPRPLPGESLSSWRQRAGLANGFIRFPLQVGARYNRDFDRLPPEGEFQWLADSFRISNDDIRGMAIDCIGGGVFTHFGKLKKPRWVVPVGTRMAGQGSAYCPRCLAEDVEPYFRLSWRLAFLCSCPFHGCSLSESCPECGTSVWPAVFRIMPAKQLKSFSHCAMCGASLTGCNIQMVNDDFSRLLWQALTTGDVPIEVSQCETVVEMLEGFWCISQLLMRRASAPLHAALSSEQEHIELPWSTVELLSLPQRKAILGLAFQLMLDWPNRFLCAMRDAGMTRQHIARSQIPFPKWLSRVTDTNLTLRTRVTNDAIAVAVADIRQSGRALSKMEVRRFLGISEAQALNAILSQRRRATFVELKLLCSYFERDLALAPEARAERATLMRDYLIVLIAVLKRVQVEKVCGMSREEVTATLARYTLSTEFDELRCRALNLNDAYERTTRDVLASGRDAVNFWFISRFGRKLEGHSVRARVAALMRDAFPAELWRSVDVFTSAASNDLLDGCSIVHFAHSDHARSIK